MFDKSTILSKCRLHPSRVKSIYSYGSRVYGTYTEKSDWDFIVIANNSSSCQEIRSSNLNIHILTPDAFLSNLKDHVPSAIECLFLPEKFKILELDKINFNLKVDSLRHSFSHKSSNSWVKSKKKINQGDTYLGLKSLFHSLRIPMFGIQILEHGRIIDYSCSNFLHTNIFSKQWNSWEELDNEFRPIRNDILTKFRSLSFK